MDVCYREARGLFIHLPSKGFYYEPGENLKDLPSSFQNLYRILIKKIPADRGGAAWIDSHDSLTIRLIVGEDYSDPLGSGSRMEHVSMIELQYRGPYTIIWRNDAEHRGYRRVGQVASPEERNDFLINVSDIPENDIFEYVDREVGIRMLGDKRHPPRGGEHDKSA